ncbi:MAG TPA: hypothetical protein VHW64_01705 [Nocardioides sp.]|jgi:hypothetical protein|uniref:hypothetical protein n=1 Tax=Nocardioides sp. TaxID=35761 RepID=UPI002E3458EC|nr:hypothetical protein [Nocardioides sp.]HEX3929389.1 hypothetical protein [Nocardioides sp.]
MRRILATTLTAAALVGAGATAASAQSSPVGVARVSISVSNHSSTQCDVELSWTPNPYAHVDHYDVQYADSQAGLGPAPVSTVRGLETRRVVNKGSAAFFALTPVLSDGTIAVTVTKKVDHAAC